MEELVRQGSVVLEGYRHQVGGQFQLMKYGEYIVIIMVVFCGLPGPQEKDDSARRIWILDIIFSHVGNERACALHPQE